MTAKRSTRKKTPPAERSTSAPVDDRRDDFSEEAEAEIEEFFAAHSQESVVAVYRVGKPGERDGYIETLSISTLMNPGPEPVISKAYGAGNYKLKLKSPNQRGVLQYAGSKTITIAERPGAPAPTNGHNGGGAFTMEQFLLQQMAKSEQTTLALIQNMKPQALDLQGLAALLVAITGGNNKQSDIGSLVTAFTQLKASAEPPNTVEQIKSAIELARSLTPGAPGAGPEAETDTGWGGVIKGALSAFAGMTGGGPAGGRQALPPGGGPGGPDHDDEEEPGANDMQQYLAAQLGYLKTKATAGKPVEQWIEYTLSNQEDAGNAALMAALRGGATFAHLEAFDPEIAQNPVLRVWFQKFYDGLKRGPLSTGASVPWIGRDITNPANNAGAGTEGQPNPGSAPAGGTPGGPVNAG